MDKAVRGRIEAIAAEAAAKVAKIMEEELDYIDDPHAEAVALTPAFTLAIVESIEKRITPAFSDMALKKITMLQDRGYDVTSLVLTREGRADRAFVSPFGRVDWLASPVTIGERDVLCDMWSEISTPFCIAICPKCGYHNHISNEWKGIAGERMGLECAWCTHKSPNAGEPNKVVPDFEVRLFIPHDTGRMLKKRLQELCYYEKGEGTHCCECYEELGYEHVPGCSIGWLESHMNPYLGGVELPEETEQA